MQKLNQDGEPRRVGVEMEFGGLDIETILARIQAVVGGEIERVSSYEARVRETSLGDISVELDALLFRTFKLRGFLQGLELDWIKADFGEAVERVMATEARRFVPYEVVFPPLEIERLEQLEPVREALRQGAEGTESAVYHAFGLHFNPELPRLDAATILAYLRAFLVAYETLKERHQVDPARRISPFISPFPKAYVIRVLDGAYAPGEDQLIEDYLEFNPTRNRPLDLLPILAWIDQERVQQHLPEEKISRRPTLHYRLPDCRIDDPNWTIGQEWRHWELVESLVDNPGHLVRQCRRERSRLLHPWRFRLRRWLGGWRR